jgi:transcriptional regulator with XRE-family HTH domain
VIRQARETQGLDRKELAEAAGISYSYLSAIESGQKLPSGTVQTSLAASLGVAASELLARANGELEVQPRDQRAYRDVAASMVRADLDPGEIAPAARMAAMSARSMMASESAPEPRVSPSGALAELQSLIPTLSPEDAAMVVSVARRLAGDPGLRQPPQSRRTRGTAGRELRTEAYLAFWTRYVDELDRQGLDWAHGRRPEPRSYFTTPSPIRGASLSASFARNRLLRHELYINRGSRSANLELLRELESSRGLIETAYGHRLEFEDPGRERRAVRIAEYRDGHISRSDEYGDYIAWFIDRGMRARSALNAYLNIA